MSLDNCVKHGSVQSSRWRLTTLGMLCDSCFKPRKVRADILTTTSHRVQQDRLDNEKEMLQPYGVGEKPNPKFLENYPTHAPDYYSSKDLKELGAPKMKSRKHEVFKGDNSK